MSSNYECINRINLLKQGIEATTGEVYTDLTLAVQELKNGYGASDGNFQSCLNGSISGEVDLSNLTRLRTGILAECRNVTNVIMPSDIDEVPEYAFYFCSSLTDITIPESVTRIGFSAFSYCGLTNIVIPDNVTDILDEAFSRGSVRTVTIGSSVDSIGTYAFIYSGALHTVTFKGTPGHISDDVFRSCDNLTTINVPWSEGEVTNAPWGATNATINYNHTGG